MTRDDRRPTPAGPLTVYHHGSCPLCRRAIGSYRRRPGGDAVSWVDVSPEADTALPGDLDREHALARIHVRLPDGRLVQGARDFAALWAAMPGFRLLGRIAGTAPVAPLLELAYRLFLRLRPAMQRIVARLDATC